MWYFWAIYLTLRQKMHFCLIFIIFSSIFSELRHFRAQTAILPEVRMLQSIKIIVFKLDSHALIWFWNSDLKKINFYRFQHQNFCLYSTIISYYIVSTIYKLYWRLYSKMSEFWKYRRKNDKNYAAYALLRSRAKKTLKNLKKKCQLSF